MSKQKIIGARIRQIRSECGFTQEELGHRADLHSTYVGAVERGEVNISLANLEKLATALNIQLHEVFIGDGLTYGSQNGPAAQIRNPGDLTANPVRQLSEISKWTTRICKDLDKLNNVMANTRSFTIEVLGDVVNSIIGALEHKSNWKLGHAQNVRHNAELIGQSLGLSADENNELKLASLLHDIGIMLSNEDVWEKKGHLTKEDYGIIRAHPIEGEEIFRSVEGFESICLAIRHHHEHWDGGGYPDALMGEQIPLYARIIAVAEAEEAMTATDRPYRKALTGKEAVRILKGGSGKQFDPEIVKAFLKIKNTSTST